jgi:hypothetical protein
MGANPRLKNRRQFTTATRPELLDGLRKLSEKTRIAMSLLIDEALEDLLKKYRQDVRDEDAPL